MTSSSSRTPGPEASRWSALRERLWPRPAIPPPPDPAAVRVLAITLPRANPRDQTAVLHLLSSLMTGAPFSLELLGDAGGRQLLARGDEETLCHIRQQLQGAYTDVHCRLLSRDEDPAGLNSLAARPQEGPAGGAPGGESAAHRSWPDRTPAVAACRMGLRRPPFYPLHTFSQEGFADGDPVQALLGALVVEPGQLAHVQLVLAPAPLDWADRWQGYAYTSSVQVRGQNSPAQTGLALAAVGQMTAVAVGLLLALALWLAALAHPSPAAWLRLALGAPALCLTAALLAWLLEGLKRRLRVDAPGNPEVIRDKLTRPAFYADLRLRAVAPDPAAARRLLDRLAAALATLNRPEGNDLVVLPQTPRPVDDLTVEGRYGALGMGPPMVLNVAEVAALWHLPVGELLEGAEGKLPRTMLARPDWFQPGSTLIGTTARGGRRVPFGLSPEMLRRNLLLVGKTQVGKSNLQVVLAQAVLADPETALVVLDPHQDMVNWVLSLVPPERVDDVIYIDVGNEALSVGLNLFDLGLGIPGHKLVDDFVSMGSTLWRDTWGPRMESALRAAAALIMAVNNIVPADRQMTVLDIPYLFSYPRVRRRLLTEYVSDPALISWWQAEWESETPYRQAEISSPVRTKIHRFQTAPPVRNMVAQPTCTVDIRRAIHERKILLVNTATGAVGEETGGFVGAVVLNYLNAAVREFAALPRHERPRLVALIDEFQSVPGVNYGALLGELQKTGAGFVLGTQSLSQMRDAQAGAARGGMDRSMVAMLLSNIHTLVAFQVSGEDARFLVDEFDDFLEVADLTNLDRHAAYVKTSLDGRRLPVVHIDTVLAPAGSPEVATAIRKQVPRYATPADQVYEEYKRSLLYWYELNPEPGASEIKARLEEAPTGPAEDHMGGVEQTHRPAGPTTSAEMGGLATVRP